VAVQQLTVVEVVLRTVIDAETRTVIKQTFTTTSGHFQGKCGLADSPRVFLSPFLITSLYVESA